MKPEGSPELWLLPTLTDDRGKKVTMVSEYIGRVKGGAIGIIQQFDAGDSAAVEPAPERLELRLLGQLQRHIEESGAGGKSSLKPVDVGAPMRFNLSVPLAPSRVLEPNLTVASGGKKATLERVVIAPSQTRVYFSGDVGKHIITRLSTGGGRAPSLGGYGVWQGWWSAGENATAAAFVDPSLADEHGQWELRVEPVAELEETPYADYPTPVPSTDPVGEGPWVFRFTVP